MERFRDLGALAAAKVVEIGAGVVVERAPGFGGLRALIDTTDVPRIRAAITSALADPDLRLRSGRIAEEMATTPDVDEVLDRLLADASGSCEEGVHRSPRQQPSYGSPVPPSRGTQGRIPEEDTR